MGETASEIKRQIDEERRSLGENLNELEARAKNAVDWKSRVRERPFTAIGLAVGAGAIIGALSVRSDTSEPEFEALTEPRAQRFSSVSSNPLWARRKSKVVSTLDTFTDAVMGVATEKVADFLSNLMPGFGEHFHRAERERRNSD